MPSISSLTRTKPKPVPYFHVVFTPPATIAAVAFQNKAEVYGLLFQTAAETLTTIAKDAKRLGAEIGLTAVLHTWGQNLDHHPTPLHRAGRRPLGGSRAVGSLSARLLLTRPRALASVPALVPRRPRDGV
jgi:hypothetical protein